VLNFHGDSKIIDYLGNEDKLSWVSPSSDVYCPSGSWARGSGYWLFYSDVPTEVKLNFGRPPGRKAPILLQIFCTAPGKGYDPTQRFTVEFKNIPVSE